jgi:hypothetical protein
VRCCSRVLGSGARALLLTLIGVRRSDAPPQTIGEYLSDAMKRWRAAHAGESMGWGEGILGSLCCGPASFTTFLREELTKFDVEKQKFGRVSALTGVHSHEIGVKSNALYRSGHRRGMHGLGPLGDLMQASAEVTVEVASATASATAHVAKTAVHTTVEGVKAGAHLVDKGVHATVEGVHGIARIHRSPSSPRITPTTSEAPPPRAGAPPSAPPERMTAHERTMEE